MKTGKNSKSQKSDKEVGYDKNYVLVLQVSFTQTWSHVKSYVVFTMIDQKAGLRYFIDE